jgi:hypothetical protein
VPYTFKHGDRPLEGITVQRAIGRGGFGEVYYAVTDSGKQLALKYLRESPEIELRGIGHVMNLKSPHLITIYDVRFNAAGEPFVLMEYVAGPSLRELLLAEPQGFSPPKAAFFLDGIVRGLSYLHERGIVHRDLKPANIFYDDGYVKIGDYGLTKHISVSRHSGQTVSVGTVHYMAPEIGSGSYTKAIDIYALGVILYEMLTGRVPFSGASMGEILMRHLADRPDLTGIPEPFAGVIAKALAKDPADRFADVSQMADAIRRDPAVGARIDAFDPTTLTCVPRRPEAPDEPTAFPPRPSGPGIDARVPPTVTDRFAQVAGRAEKKARKIACKLERKAAKLAERYAEYRPSRPAVATIPRAHRRMQFFVLMLLMLGIALALSFIGPQPSQADRLAALALALMGATAGPLLSYFYLLNRLPWRGGLWERLVYVAVTAAFLLPAYAVAADAADETRAAAREQVETLRPMATPQPKSRTTVREQAEEVAARGRGRSVRAYAVGRRQADRFAYVLVAPLAALAICNWTRRIEIGRTGQLSGGQVFWPAIVGLIAASIVDVDAEEYGYHWVAAGFCAAQALLVPAGAALWACAAAQTTPSRPTAPASAPIQAKVAAPTAALQPQARETVVPPVVIETGTSVFGWTLGTGLAVLARLLLTAGLILGLGREPLRRWLTAAGPADANGLGLLNQVLEPNVVLAALLAGSLVTVLSRAGSGWLHVLRGVAGCSALLAAVTAAMGPSGEQLWTLVLGPQPGGAEADLSSTVVYVVFPLVVGFVLLAWPPRYRKPGPVVV